MIVVVESCIQTCYMIRRNCHFALPLELRPPDTAAQMLGTAGAEALGIAATEVLDTSEERLLDTVVVERPGWVVRGMTCLAVVVSAVGIHMELAVALAMAIVEPCQV